MMNLIDSVRWATLFAILNTVYMYTQGWSWFALFLTYTVSGAITFLFLVVVNTVAEDYFNRESEGLHT